MVAEIRTIIAQLKLLERGFEEFMVKAEQIKNNNKSLSEEVERLKKEIELLNTPKKQEGAK